MTQQLDNILQLPAPYQTSLAVRTAISQAYSGYFNARGLEAYWYAPYLHTFSELATPYDGHLIANCQHPLYIPALRMRELSIRKEFRDRQLPFDSDDEGYNELTDEDLRDDGDGNNGDGDILGDLLDTGEDQGRTSKRLFEANIKRKKTELERRRGEMIELLKEKEQLIEDMEEYARQVTLANHDGSLVSIASEPEPNAKNMIPDFALCHITFYELPQPANDSEWHHYQHRAGVKVTHQCCALLGELKKAPRRTFRGPARLHDTYSLMTQAQTEVLTYCAAYFEGNAQAEPVIALAATGPYWKWAVISFTDVEGLHDWADHTENDERAKELRKKFQPRPFVLGTRKSDRELTKISQQHIYPLLSIPHVDAI